MKEAYPVLLMLSDDWLKYAIRLNVYHEPQDGLSQAEKAALTDERIRGFLRDVSDFHAVPVTNHRNPELPIHKLLFLLDLGFGTSVPEIKAAVSEILKHQDDRGVFQSLINIPRHFGGTGENAFSWSLCDAPLLLLTLQKAGLDYPRYIKPGVEYLASLFRDNGFPCAASPALGGFHGPGRKEDACPYATLIMADLLAHIPQYRESAAAASCVEALLSLWEHSLERHPYIFYMGTDFRKLKAPSIWYDIVAVAGVLSKYRAARADPRFLGMLSLIRGKQDGDGFFTPESVYLKLKNWDFGQKKRPSPYLTYLCLRILDRAVGDA